jgi:predicted Holliday junction resolvase-like endonuclease
MDETTAKWLLLAFLVISVILLIIVLSQRHKSKEKIDQYLKIINDRENHIKRFELLTENQKLEFRRTEAEVKLKSQQWALSELEKYKTTELAGITKAIEENAINAAANLLQQWKAENEAKIRQDAANRSYAVNLGKITEHLVPFHTKFPFNPKDAKFIGNPIDLIVFDGASDEEEKVTIYFVEIKTGKSRLSSKQQKIKSAVLNREIIWYEINPNDL